MPNNHRPPTATRVAAGTLRLNLPFRRSDALQAGLTDDDLISTRFRRLLHGIYISADVPVTPAITVLAAMRTVTGTSFATHHTAATLLGAAVPLTAWTHLGTVAGAMTVRRQIRLRRYAARPRQCGVPPSRRLRPRFPGNPHTRRRIPSGRARGVPENLTLAGVLSGSRDLHARNLTLAGGFVTPGGGRPRNARRWHPREKGSAPPSPCGAARPVCRARRARERRGPASPPARGRCPSR